jgi:GntR family transcriptional regulator
VPTQRRSSHTLHIVIAEKILAEIDSGSLTPGEVLPSESALACRYRVARGTVRRALEHIAVTHRRLSRRGARWMLHPATLSQDVTQLRSFGQWAKAIGHVPGGRTVTSVEGRATAEEAHALGVRANRPVLRITRVQSLDGDPVMLKRTTFPQWLIPTIEQVPADASSIMEVVEDVHGPQLAHGENLISAILPDSEDARLLGIARSTPLLRIQRTARTFDGRPFEYSDDRYLSTATALSVVNSAHLPAHG